MNVMRLRNNNLSAMIKEINHIHSKYNDHLRIEIKK